MKLKNSLMKVPARQYCWLACLALLASSALQTLCAAPPFLWAQTAGTMYPYTNGTMSLRSALATDSGGNVYVTGGFRGAAIFGTNTLVSFGNEAAADVFVAKYDPEGRLQWVHQAGGDSDDNGSGIAVDAENNVYVTGYFQGTAAFGSTNVTSQGDYDVFIAKYNTAGTLLWIKTAGGTFRDQGQALALDGAGNVCVTGEFNLTATFGSFALTNVWQDDVFVTKLDKDGNFLWASSGGGLSQDFGFSVAADQAGNVYVTGYIQYTGIFGTIAVPPLFDPPYWYDIFVAKYDPTGAPVWVRRAGSASADGGEAVAVDLSGNVYVTGWLGGPSVFGSTNLPYGGSFLAKYSNSGEVEWAKLGEYGQGNAIACDAQGGVYVAGEALLSIYSEGGYGSRDIVVAKYDAQGRRQWLQNAGSSYADSGNAIALDAARNIYISGFFQGNYGDLTAHFGSLTLTNSGVGHHDNFVAKLASEGVPLEIRQNAGKIKLSWPSLAPGLILQQSTNLLEANAWVIVPTVTNAVELPATAPQLYFRLIH
jgi:hypothetical protein